MIDENSYERRNFGDINSDVDNAHYFDLGGTYLFQTNIQFDTALGYGLNKAADDWFILGGLTLRFPR